MSGFLNVSRAFRGSPLSLALLRSSKKRGGGSGGVAMCFAVRAKTELSCNSEETKTDLLLVPIPGSGHEPVGCVADCRFYRICFVPHIFV